MVESMIYSIMRIKNEARWIKKVIEAQLPIVERIFILDDHSDDDTVAICESFEKVTLIRSPFEGLDEARDKNYLLEQIEKIAKRGDWIISIDGDEELAPGSAIEIKKIAAQSLDCAYRFNVLYLWNNPKQIRVDGVFGRCNRPSMFSLVPGRRFSSPNGGGLHCGNVPEMQNVRNSTVRLLHYGWMEREDRIRKYNWYNSADKQPIPEVEDGYRHAIIGDLLPAETKTRWAGPLELRPL
jgi:glycosyltransferase involved in cell wall biosynthesis